MSARSAAQQLPTENPRAMAHRALATADQFLQAAVIAVPSIAVRLRQGQLQVALPEVARLLDGIGALAQMATDLAQVFPHVTAPAPIDLRRLSALIQEVVDTEERGDWPHLAVLFDTRIAADVLAWRDAFRAFGAQV